jgi:hypothetical protein
VLQNHWPSVALERTPLRPWPASRGSGGSAHCLLRWGPFTSSKSQWDRRRWPGLPEGEVRITSMDYCCHGIGCCFCRHEHDERLRKRRAIRWICPRPQGCIESVVEFVEVASIRFPRVTGTLGIRWDLGRVSLIDFLDRHILPYFLQDNALYCRPMIRPSR